MKIFFTALLFIELCSLCDAFAKRPIDTAGKEAGEVEEEVHERKRRSFHSYYYNYYDEMAMSICASVPGAARHVFPVRRACTSASKTTCAMVCKDPNLRKQRPAFIGSNTKWSCIESLHIYKGRPLLADNQDANNDSSKIGLVMYRYHSCANIACGPNYCCCRAY